MHVVVTIGLFEFPFAWGAESAVPTGCSAFLAGELPDFDGNIANAGRESRLAGAVAADLEGIAGL